MPLQRYRFDAPAGHTLVVGDDVHEPGTELELPVGQVDPRLTPVGDEIEGTEDTRSLSETVQDEVDSIDEAELEAAEAAASTAKPAETAGFGNPRPPQKSGK